MAFVFDPVPQPALPVLGQSALYPVRRVFCVGRNYAAHAAEMGNTVDRSAPWYFTKSAHHVAASGLDMPYPSETQDLHHEVELVVALGGPVEDDPMAAVFGYAVGFDMTRRDLQASFKERRLPWCPSKDFENGAVIGTISPAGPIALQDQRICAEVNGVVRQDQTLADMVWSVPEILVHLSGLYDLGAGDLVMTGTPSGVSAVVPGDRLVGRVDGLEPVSLRIV